MIDGLAMLTDGTEAWLAGFMLVFTRVGAVVALLPGFGERMIPARVKLGVAVAFSVVTWSLLGGGLTPDHQHVRTLRETVGDQAGGGGGEGQAGKSVGESRFAGLPAD